MRKAILVLQGSEWSNTLQQYSPRQLQPTKFTSCFGDLAHRQGVSYPSLIWLGAAAALDFWTVSPCLKLHFKLPPCLPHFPDYQSLNAKQNTSPIIQLLWWGHANLHQMHHTNTRAPSTSAPARKFPQISPRTSSCSEVSTGHCKLWLGLLTCVDSDEVIPSSADLFARPWFEDFYYWVGFFPSGKKAALAERQEMRLLPWNEGFTSLLYTDFLHYHIQSAWPQLPSLPCRDGGKKKTH